MIREWLLHPERKSRFHNIVPDWVWILSKNNDFDFLERAGIEYMEYLMSEGKDMCPFIFTFDECNQLFKVWFVEFFL